jgi:hypothetical protein
LQEKYEFGSDRKVFLVLRDGTEIDSGGSAKNWRLKEWRTGDSDSLADVC